MHHWEQEKNKEPSLQALYMEINRRYAKKCLYQMEQFGIYPGQIPVLKLLKEKDGRSQKELAQLMHVKPPTIHVMIQRLEKAEMVCRRQDEMDQRVSRIYLTERGRELLAQAMETIRENEKVLFGNFSEEELALIRSFFQKILVNIEELPGTEKATEGSGNCCSI